MAAVRRIKIEPAGALQRLSKLEQAVDATVSKLLGYVTNTWRSPQILRIHIADIRDIAGKAKVALRLLTEFALSTLVNARDLPSQEMSSKLSRSVEPLLETYYSVKLALQRLDNDNWKAPLEKPENIHDDLDSIMVYMQTVPDNSSKLVAVIRSGATILYRSSEKNASQPRKPARPPHSKQQHRAAANNTQTSVANGRQNEVEAKLEKFGAAPMRAESSEVQSITMMAGYIKEAVDANIKPQSSGQKLSPTTVRRLCGMDLPRPPSWKDGVSGDVGRKDSYDSDEAPTLPARRPSEISRSPPPPPPPERKDSGERCQHIRQKSLDKFTFDNIPNAPPPKPKLNRKNTSRRSYKYPRFTAEQKKERAATYVQDNHVPETNIEPPKRKCNSDPTKINEIGNSEVRSEGQFSSNRASDSFDKKDATSISMSRQALVHVSDSDLPQSLGHKQSVDSPQAGLRSPKARPLLGFLSGDSSSNGFAVSLNDKELLEFYRYEIDAQLFLLSEAIKGFFASIDGNQPPKVFVSNSKFIVLSAHKFIFIGDTLQKRAGNKDLKEQVQGVTNKLSDNIKALVGATKSAALHYPATNAMKEVANAVKLVSTSAIELHGIVKHTTGKQN